MHDAEEAQSLTVTDPAALAFEALRKEVALVRRAVAGLAAERSAVEIPDYSETLGEILHASAAAANTLKAIGELPPLRQTPQALAHEIAAAGEDARRSDQQALWHAREAFEVVTHDLTANLRSARSSEKQRGLLVWTGAGGILAGMLLCAVGANMIAHAMPENWYWPERMAARVLRMDREAAGARLIETAAPDRWRDIVLGYQIVEGNRETIAKCKEEGSAETRSMRCAVEIGKSD